MTTMQKRSKGRQSLSLISTVHGGYFVVGGARRDDPLASPDTLFAGDLDECLAFMRFMIAKHFEDGPEEGLDDYAKAS